MRVTGWWWSSFVVWWEWIQERMEETLSSGSDQGKHKDTCAGR